MSLSMDRLQLSPRAVLLISVKEMGGEVLGRTLLQKRMYFIGELLGVDMDFRSHFYGPYSSLVHGEAVQATTLGLLSESNSTGSPVPGESRRIDYRLTKVGALAATQISATKEEDAKRVKQAVAMLMGTCGSLDGAALSIAAKVHFILSRRSDELLDEEDIRLEAQKLRWDVVPEKISEGTDALIALGLVKQIDFDQ